MKTIKKGKAIKRASDKDAEAQVKKNKWKYCPKSEWRKQQAKSQKSLDKK